MNIQEIRPFFGSSGDLAAAPLPEFERAAQACLQAKVAGIVIDLAGVDYLSSPGLRAIVALATRLEERKGQVIVRGARDAVRVTLGLADFTRTRQSRWR